MPDQTVKVTFTAPSTFTFDKPTTTMTAARPYRFFRYHALCAGSNIAGLATRWPRTFASATRLLRES